jgi:hypothetical protein
MLETEALYVAMAILIATTAVARTIPIRDPTAIEASSESGH